MHEAGIVSSVLEIAEDEARKRGARSIRVVKMRVGEFSGVAVESLQFAFEALKVDTMAAGGQLEIERVPMLAWCTRCEAPVKPDANLVLWCPRCSSPLEVRSGQELDVEYIEIEEERAAEENAAWNESA
jgi:hydrogenase nickel incorporation protein HypA/HybF